MIVAEKSRKWWVLTAMGGVMGLILLDETVVGVALPTVQKDLAMTQGAAHWVINAYLLVFAGLAAAGGKLSDIIGHKATMLSAVVLFGLSSAVCGFCHGRHYPDCRAYRPGCGRCPDLPGIARHGVDCVPTG